MRHVTPATSFLHVFCVEALGTVLLVQHGAVVLCILGISAVTFTKVTRGNVPAPVVCFPLTSLQMRGIQSSADATFYPLCGTARRFTDFCSTRIYTKKAKATRVRDLFTLLTLLQSSLPSSLPQSGEEEACTPEEQHDDAYDIDPLSLLQNLPLASRARAWVR